jgi:mandelamide amidase
MSRRGFLLGASAAAASAALAAPAGDEVTELTGLSATQAVLHMSRGELAVERYARALLARCETMRALNAFITLEPERVLESARALDRARAAGARPGPLFGLPIPVKDSVNTRDYRTSAGTPALRDFQPAADAPIVAALRGAGAIVLGKTNLHELSFGWTSNNLAFGAVRNPYAPDRIPGGSSGGTAAAVAARMAPLGVAEDTEGSIRVPAALCGIAGFRPTTGRYPTQGCVPISPLFDQVGPQARSVEDLLLFDAVVARDARAMTRTSLAGVRLGVVRDYWFGGLDPELEQLTDAALARLTAAGAEIVETRLDGLAALIDATTTQIQLHDVRVALARYLAEYHVGKTFAQVVAAASPDVRGIFADYVLPGGAHFTSDAAYREARDRHLPALHALYRHYFARHPVDAIVFPTTLTPAPRIGADASVTIAGVEVPFETAIARNIAPGSTAGLPGLVLPAGLTRAGLPVALEFDGAVGTDRALLGLGVALERALGPIPAPGA